MDYKIIGGCGGGCGSPVINKDCSGSLCIETTGCGKGIKLYHNSCSDTYYDSFCGGYGIKRGC